MNLKNAVFLLVLSGLLRAQNGTTVKHIQTQNSAMASAVWVGDTLFVSGQLASPVKPPDTSKGIPAVYGDTQTQSISAFTKLAALLKEQGLTTGDVVMMHVYLAADPAKGDKPDFAGMNAAYVQFFGTGEQPNKPTRSSMQVAALAVPWALVEVEVVAAKSK